MYLALDVGVMEAGMLELLTCCQEVGSLENLNISRMEFWQMDTCEIIGLKCNYSLQIFILLNECMRL